MSPTQDSKSLKSDALRLNGLFEKTARARAAWLDQDFGPILRHQLNAPLNADIPHLLPNIQDILSEVPNQTFGQLLLQSQPPIAVLTLVKDFAKRLSRHANNAYPQDVATALYYASIAAAVRAGARITNLHPAELRRGFQWALNLAWLPVELKPLFDDALNAMARG